MASYYIYVDGREIGLDIVHSEAGTLIKGIDEGEGPQAAHVDFAAVHADPSTGAGLYSLLAGGRSYQIHVERVEEGFRMVTWQHRFDISVLSEREWRLQKVAPRQSQAGGQVTVKAPMPGLVKAVLVAQGEEVQSGQRLVVLEAMKMENEITAPSAGRVSSVHVASGSTVDGGKPLVTLE